MGSLFAIIIISYFVASPLLHSPSRLTSLLFWPSLVVLPVAIYGLLLTLFNVTSIELSSIELMIHHRPIFWPRKKLARAQIQQIYVLTVKRHNGGMRIDLYALIKGEDHQERHVCIVPNVTSFEVARTIDRRIELALGIEDWPNYNTVQRV